MIRSAARILGRETHILSPLWPPYCKNSVCCISVTSVKGNHSTEPHLMAEISIRRGVGLWTLSPPGWTSNSAQGIVFAHFFLLSVVSAALDSGICICSLGIILYYLVLTFFQLWSLMLSVGLYAHAHPHSQHPSLWPVSLCVALLWIEVL